MIWIRTYFLLAHVTRIFDGRQGEGAMTHHGLSLNQPLHQKI